MSGSCCVALRNAEALPLHACGSSPGAEAGSPTWQGLHRISSVELTGSVNCVWQVRPDESVHHPSEVKGPLSQGTKLQTHCARPSQDLQLQKLQPVFLKLTGGPAQPWALTGRSGQTNTVQQSPICQSVRYSFGPEQAWQQQQREQGVSPEKKACTALSKLQSHA